MKADTAHLRSTERKIGWSRGLSRTFALSAMAGSLAVSGGAITAMGTYGYDMITSSSEHTIVHAPSAKALDTIKDAGLVAGFGFGGMLVAGFALEATYNRRRKYQQDKYTITITMIKDGLKPKDRQP